MADKKISQLTAVSTPLAGTEVLPIVQSGVTKKVTALELTGATVDSAGNITIANGNFVIGTAGKGIDFSATAGAGTSELLDDYEEGTWTPVDSSSAGLSFVEAAGIYTKIGRMVYWQAVIVYPITANGTGAEIGGLPFALALINSTAGRSGSTITATDESTLVQSLQLENNTVRFLKAAFVQNTNAELSGNQIYCSGFYSVA